MMIQLTLREDDPMTDFIEARAAQLQRDRTEIAQEVVHEAFYALVHDLHQQFMAGEISQGRMAEELGIGRADLIHLLERLELAVTNL
jgi:hypothetical protein